MALTRHLRRAHTERTTVTLAEAFTDDPETAAIQAIQSGRRTYAKPLSIIIPTYNEERFLPDLLESLKHQTYIEFEVIVADNHSTDHTRSIALSSGARVVEGGLPARGRNNGAKVANGEWLLFLDADVILPPDFVEKAMAEIKLSDCSTVSCLMHPLTDRQIDKVLHTVVNAYFRATRKVKPHAPGFCIFSKKETHELMGGFDEKIKFAEDHDYAARASKISGFDLLQSVRIPVSTRRLDKEGRLGISIKYLAAEMYLIVVGPIYTNLFEYKLGCYDKDS
jgi:glycosyltransferase involved in cell wall biosynthesis